MASEPDVSTIVPSNRSTIRHRLPSTGSSGRVPPLPGYYAVLRLPAAPPAALRRLRLAVPRWAHSSLPGEGSPPAWVSDLVTRKSTGGSTRRRQGLLGSWGARLRTCPALRPRRSRGEPCHRGTPIQPSTFSTVSASASSCPYAAPSRGLHAPCVRFAAPVARSPRNTRFPLLARLCGAGFGPAGLLEGVSSYVIPSPPSRLCPAH